MEAPFGLSLCTPSLFAWMCCGNTSKTKMYSASPLGLYRPCSTCHLSLGGLCCHGGIFIYLICWHLCTVHLAILCFCSLVFSVHLPSLGWLYSLAYSALFGCTLRLCSWAQSLPNQIKFFLADDGHYHLPVFQPGKSSNMW